LVPKLRFNDPASQRSLPQFMFNSPLMMQALRPGKSIVQLEVRDSRN
jgi:hypothetical protein